MSSIIKRTVASKLKSVVMYLVTLAIVLGGVSYAAPKLFGQVAHAVNTNTSPVIVDVYNLQPSWTAVNGGGVYSAYVGPPAYVYVSPGETAVYDGLSAGIIKAGLNIDDDGHYWDEGLFGFQPTVTIDTFAAETVNYNVENQEGTNPVWMTIEIDTGIAGDRSDNTTYQFVPTTNPAGWHTVNAAAGQWQLMDDDGNGTGLLMSLSNIASANTGRNVVRAYLRLGMGDSYHGSGLGTIAWVDQATLGGVTYDFVVAPTPSSITNPATGISSTDATLNGTNGAIDATGHSFWVSLAPFVTTSPTIPDGVYSTPDFGAIAANSPFSTSLSYITTTGIPANLPAVTPGTLYYYVAWSEVGGTWYPGEVLNFTTANFEINQYMVTFDTNGGSLINPVTLDYDSTVTVPVNPTKVGFVFVGWYSDASLTTPWVFSNHVTEDMTLYAKWTPVVVTFTYIAGAGGTIDGAGSKSQSLNYGDNTTTVTAVASDGYHFTGWSDGVTSATRNDTNVKASRSVTAYFAANVVALVTNTVTGGEVLGDTTTAPTTDTTKTPETKGDVKGTSDSKKEDAPWYDAAFMGLAWYWWVVLAIAAGGLGWWAFGAIRNRNQN